MIIAKHILLLRNEKFRRKLTRSMKLISTLLMVLFVQLSVQARSQSKITLKLKNVELTKAISLLEANSDYRFVYSNNLIPATKIDANFRQADLPEVMEAMLKGTGLSYRMMKEDLVVLYKPEANEVNADVTVNGRVTDENGVGLNGASVNIKGSGKGTSTSTDGTFSITVPDNAVLIVSYVGYQQREIAVGGRTEINIQLQPSVVTGEQVVVIGYGTSRKRDLTGSVATIKGSEIAKQPVLTATQAIQGRVAGVQIISSGAPNSLPTVRVRGTGTLLGGQDPLYVVDGVITTDIRNINTADIVNMQVLKDASATAIYGMRAANGVLIITTKQGSGRFKVAYDASVGVKEVSKLVNMAGAKQYANYVNEASVYYGSGDSIVTNAQLANGANTDWYDEVLRPGLQQNHNLSISGGSDRINYFFSAGYIGDEGIIRTNKFDRFTLRSNNEYKIAKIFKVSTLVSYSRFNLRDVDLSVFNIAYRAAPYIAAKVGDKYGNTSLSNNVGNPLLNLEKTNNQTLGNRVQGTIIGELKPLTWLTLRTSYGVDLDFLRSTNYGFAYANTGLNSVFLTNGGNQIRQNSSLAISNNNATKWVWDNTATVAKKFGDHDVTFLAGITSEQYKFNSIAGTRLDVPENTDQWYLNAGDPATSTNTNSGDKWTRSSYISRLNYGYKGKYLLTATMRADGTSRLPESNRWGYFPAIGAAWNIASESFMGNQQTFDVLKLRASWGRVGNDQISTNTFLPLATTGKVYIFDGTQYRVLTFDQAADKNIQWETTEEFNFGLDFGLLKNRLTGEIDVYDKRTKNALINVGFNGQYVGDVDNLFTTNAASFSNKGIELGLNWSDRVRKGWNYSMNANAAFNKNRITGLNGGQALFSGGVGGFNTTKSDNDQPIGSFFLLDAIGVFQNAAEVAASAQTDAKPGDLKYADISGPAGKPDGVINDFDRRFFGSYIPKATFGFNIATDLMGFDLSINTYGTVGSKIYNGKRAARPDTRDNVETEVANNRWTPGNTNTSIPRANLNQLPASSYFLENGDFLRINNLTVGYTLPKSVVNKWRVENLRFYATAQNLVTITGYSGFTPELQSDSPLNGGIELGIYPTTRTFAFGVNLGF